VGHQAAVGGALRPLGPGHLQADHHGAPVGLVVAGGTFVGRALVSAAPPPDGDLRWVEVLHQAEEGEGAAGAGLGGGGRQEVDARWLQGTCGTRGGPSRLSKGHRDVVRSTTTL